MNNDHNQSEEILLFGGTTEGRILAEYLTQNGIDFRLCVATEFGRELAETAARDILEGRLSRDEIVKLCAGYKLVIDATHPYACLVTDNIKSACRACGSEYLRVLRPGQSYGQLEPGIKFFSGNNAVVEYLNSVEGNILVTTGSKDAADFCRVKDFKKRVYLRMLPMAEGITKCVVMGYSNANLICMQGKFSVEMNVSLINKTGAKYLVTKDSGEAGGYLEKLTAAKQTGTELLVITRPVTETGCSVEEARRFLAERYALSPIEPGAPIAEPISPLTAGLTKPAAQNHAPENTRRFPLFIDLRNKPVTVVGGGRIAERRVQTLLKFSPLITVISPEISPVLAELAQAGNIKWNCREYSPGDLTGATLALAATNSRETNKAVAEEALRNGIYCSVSDSAAESRFWFPGIVTTKTGLVVGLVSDGKNHGLAKRTVARIREVLSDEDC